jgi:hypothetical protein
MGSEPGIFFVFHLFLSQITTELQWLPPIYHGFHFEIAQLGNTLFLTAWTGEQTWDLFGF